MNCPFHLQRGGAEQENENEDTIFGFEKTVFWIFVIGGILIFSFLMVLFILSAKQEKIYPEGYNPETNLLQVERAAPITTTYAPQRWARQGSARVKKWWQRNQQPQENYADQYPPMYFTNESTSLPTNLPSNYLQGNQLFD